MGKNVLFWVLLLFLVAAGCTATEGTDDEPNPVNTKDHAQIYAAAIREIQTIERSRDLVYVVTTTEDYTIFDAPTTPSQYLQKDLQQAITTELADEPYQLIWIEDFDDAPFNPVNWKRVGDWKIAGGDGLIITLGNIPPQYDGSVQLSFFMTCSDMCSIGKNFVLNQYYNNWHVTASLGREIAS